MKVHNARSWIPILPYLVKYPTQVGSFIIIKRSTLCILSTFYWTFYKRFITWRITFLTKVLLAVRQNVSWLFPILSDSVTNDIIRYPLKIIIFCHQVSLALCRYQVRARRKPRLVLHEMCRQETGEYWGRFYVDRT